MCWGGVESTSPGVRAPRTTKELGAPEPAESESDIPEKLNSVLHVVWPDRAT